MIEDLLAIPFLGALATIWLFLTDRKFAYKKRRLYYGHYFCMAVVYGRNFKQAHAVARQDYRFNYPKFIHELEEPKKQQDFSDFIQKEYSTYYLVSRSRLPQDDPFYIHPTNVPNHERYR